MRLPSSFPYRTVLFASWLIVQVTMLLFSGINAGGESERFIREADLLTKGESFTSPAFYLYLVQILLIAIVHTTGAGYTPLIVLQMLLNLYALHSLYKFILRRRKSRKIAFFGGMLLVTCIPYQLYNTFLYTESIFFSLVIIYTTILLQVKKWTLQNILMIVLWMIALCFVRPTGLFLAFATLIYFVMHLRKVSWLIKLPALFFGTGIILYTIHLVLQTGRGIDPLTPFLYEHIICDVPGKKEGTELFLEDGNNGLAALLNYVLNNPEHFAKMAVHKTAAFFGLYRPWYSTLHNLAMMIYFFALYILIGVAVFRRGLTPAFVFTTCLTLVFWLFVIFSCDEWHNRFFLTLTPLLIICATAAFGKKERSNKLQRNVVEDEA
ncbi:MAG: hypothetical protein EOO10_16490 [Chitinophagaceae bacterium]|nr:MAG: hypothetical protein EOO10_16490 [Chitinophagaceae bacterium]